MMKTSPNGLDLIKASEGFVDHVYQDAAGLDTIGYGHLVRPNESYENLVLDDSEATELLAHDVASAESAVNGLVKVLLNQNQFDALVDFTFNLGAGRLKESTLLKLVNEGKMDEAAEQFPRWVRAGGKVQPGLVTRRQKERDLWLA